VDTRSGSREEAYQDTQGERGAFGSQKYISQKKDLMKPITSSSNISVGKSRGRKKNLQFREGKFTLKIILGRGGGGKRSKPNTAVLVGGKGSSVKGVRRRVRCQGEGSRAAKNKTPMKKKKKKTQRNGGTYQEERRSQRGSCSMTCAGKNPL